MHKLSKVSFNLLLVSNMSQSINCIFDTQCDFSLEVLSYQFHAFFIYLSVCPAVGIMVTVLNVDYTQISMSVKVNVQPTLNV